MNVNQIRLLLDIHSSLVQPHQISEDVRVLRHNGLVDINLDLTIAGMHLISQILRVCDLSSPIESLPNRTIGEAVDNERNDVFYP